MEFKHYSTQQERIKSYFKEKIVDQHELDTWDFDLRSQTLLHRDAAGYYEFAHKSLAEYFVAFKFASELGSLAPVFAQTYCEAGGQPCQVQIELKDVIGLADTFGFIALSDKRMAAVSSLLQEMISADATEQLWKIIIGTKEKTPSEVKFTCSNAATLLNRLSVSFENMDFNHAILTAADLRGSRLSKANLTYCDLTAADLRGCHLSTADLTYCDLSYADLRGCKIADDGLKHAILLRTNITIFGFSESKEVIEKFQERTNTFEESEFKKIVDIFRVKLPDTIQIKACYGQSLSSYPAYIFIFECLVDDLFNWPVVREDLLKSALGYKFAFYENEVESIQHYIHEAFPKLIYYNLK